MSIRRFDRPVSVALQAESCDLSVPASVPAAWSFPEVTRAWRRPRQVAGWQPVERTRFLLEVGPAVLRLRSTDSMEGDQDPEVEERPAVEQLAFEMGDELAEELLGDVRRVTEWSERSRSRMAYRLATLDWSELPGIAEMVTLTYPGKFRFAGDSETHGSRDETGGESSRRARDDGSGVLLSGPIVKGHLRAYAERYRRRWGDRPVGSWKLEFQRRGAPHFHLYQGRPVGPAREFMAWLSLTWANIVQADGYTRWCEIRKGESGLDALARVSARYPSGPGPEFTEYGRHLGRGTGLDRDFVAAARDVRRLAVYFAKHNGKWGEAKGYQNDVPPEFVNVGRFWGVWGLRPRIEEVEVTEADFLQLRRLLAGYRRSTGARCAVRRVGRASAATGEVDAHRRRVTRRKRVRYSGRGGVYALCPNGPRMAVQFGGWLAATDSGAVRAAERSWRRAAGSGGSDVSAGSGRVGGRRCRREVDRR